MKKSMKKTMVIILSLLLIATAVFSFAACESDVLTLGKDFVFLSETSFDVSESLTLGVEVLNEKLKDEPVTFSLTNNSSTGATLTEGVLRAYRAGTISMRLDIGGKHYDFAVTVTDQFSETEGGIAVAFSKSEYSLNEGETFREKPVITKNGEAIELTYSLVFLAAVSDGYSYRPEDNSVTFLKSGSYRFYAAVSEGGAHYTSQTVTVRVTKQTGKEVSFDGYTYKIYENYAALAGYEGSETTVSIPETVRFNLDGTLTQRDVTKIESKAFYANQYVREIVLSENITEIGEEAFAYSVLEKINIPASLALLGANAFSASALYEVNSANASFTESNDCYLWQSRLIKCVSQTASVVVPHVTSMDSYAFYRLGSVETIEIPASLSGGTDEAYASLSKTFVSMTALTSVSFAGGSYYLNADAFLNCSSISYLNLTGLSGVSSEFSLCGPPLSDPDAAETYLPALKHIVYPSTFYFTDLFDYESVSPENMLTVEYSEGSLSIIADAFYGGEDCIEKLVLPASLTFAEGYRRAHEGDSYEYNLPLASLIRVKSVEVAAGNPVYKSIGGALYAYDKTTGKPTTLVFLPRMLPLVNGTYTVAEGTEKVGMYASFMKTSGTGNYDYDLKKVILPSSVKTVDSFAFRSCSYLEEIDLGAVETIGMEAFAACRSLTAVVLPETLTTLGNRAFRYCRSLAQITILAQEPPEVTDYDWLVADVKENNTPLEKYLHIFENIAQEYKIKVKTVSVYETHRLWKLFAGHYEALA